MNNRQAFAKSFADLYHAHHSRHTEDQAFWIDLAAKQGGPILELGCGTGRILIPLSQRGYRVLGLDSSPEMLAGLRSQADQPVFQADMAAFHLGMCFPLILLPCNTFSTLSPEGRRATLGCVRAHLAPEGVFAVSLPNPAMLAAVPRRGDPEVEEIFPHPVDGEPVQVSSSWLRGADHFTLTWTYDHLLPDGQVERLAAHARHTLLPLQGYLEELTAAGLQATAIYGDFDGAPYTESAPFLIILAQALSNF